MINTYNTVIDCPINSAIIVILLWCYLLCYYYYYHKHRLFIKFKTNLQLQYINCYRKYTVCSKQILKYTVYSKTIGKYITYSQQNRKYVVCSKKTRNIRYTPNKPANIHCSRNITLRVTAIFSISMIIMFDSHGMGCTLVMLRRLFDSIASSHVVNRSLSSLAH